MDWSSIERVKAEARDYVRTTSQTAVPPKKHVQCSIKGRAAPTGRKEKIKKD